MDLVEMAGFEPPQDVPKTPMLTINITSRNKTEN